MLSAEDNALLTHTGPGTAMGRVLRRYWQPLALAEELPAERPLKDVRVLGEDLVVFRDETGRYGALERRCAHRAGDLAFGRLEDGGLRCPYHGWLWDASGKCLDQPAEPADARFCDKVRQPGYPCIERNGIIYGYFGAGEAPPRASTGTMRRRAIPLCSRACNAPTGCRRPRARSTRPICPICTAI
jgi:phenylpropionate dioxygenase-like ring-hydroxylating dioxygenase large terminal subunit